LLDDTYDSYATLEDSRKLNEAIQRWSHSLSLSGFAQPAWHIYEIFSWLKF
jgi:hypothetical protein